MRRHFYSSKSVPEGGNAIVLQALQALVTECATANTKLAWLVTPGKGNLEGYVASTIGDVAAKDLGKNKLVNLTNGIQLRHYTMQTIPFGGDGSPILALYLDDKSISKIDAKDNIPAIIVVPWLCEDIQKWKDSHGPRDILGQKNASAKTMTNPVVEQALKSMLSVINMSTGITHPSDKQRAIETFRLLREGGERYEIDEVRAYLVQNGLDPEDADAVAKIAANPSASRSPAGLGKLDDSFLARWRQEAGK